jgi:hypothetical protein
VGVPDGDYLWIPQQANQDFAIARVDRVFESKDYGTFLAE